MVKQMRVSEVFGDYSRQYYELDGPIDTVIDLLVNQRDDAIRQGWSDLTVVWDCGYSSDDISWCIRGNRLETDEEEKRRVSIEAKIKEDRKKARKSREERDRKEYERLRKKFEGK